MLTVTVASQFTSQQKQVCDCSMAYGMVDELLAWIIPEMLNNFRQII